MSELDGIFDCGTPEEKVVKLSDRHVLVVTKETDRLNAGQLVYDITEQLLEEYVLSDEFLEELRRNDPDEYEYRKQESDSMKIKDDEMWVQNFDQTKDGWDFQLVKKSNVTRYPHPAKIYEQIINEANTD